MNLLTWYLERRLDSLGYGECELHYDLNHCQGDGVAWYGVLDDEGLGRILTRLGFKGSRRSVIERLSDAFTIDIRKIAASRYNHFNTMSVDLTPAFDDAAYTHAESGLLDELIEAMEVDLVACSRELEHEGYGIVDAMPDASETLRVYRHGDVEVAIEKLPPCEDIFVDEFMEPAHVYLLARRLIMGESRVYDLKVSLHHAGNGYSDDRYLDGIEDSPRDRYWLAFAREDLADLCAQYRHVTAGRGATAV